MNPNILTLTLKHLEPELHRLIGEEQWAVLRPQYTRYWVQLQAQNSSVVRLQAAANIIDLFAHYEPVQTRLRVAVEGLNGYQTVLTQLTDFARQLNVETKIVTELEEAAVLQTHDSQIRLIILQGVGQKAESIKWQNFEFDLSSATEIAETVAGILAAYSDIISPDTNHFLMAAGILLIIRSILKTSTVEISEQDASVFWGVIQAQRHNAAKRVNTAKVMEHTNQERAIVHLATLSERQIRYSLRNLMMLGSVVQVSAEQEIWQVIEKYRV